MRSTLRKAGLAAVVAAAAAGIATPASASTPTTDTVGIMASSRCFVGQSGDCTTAVIGANPTGHYVDYVINNISRYSRCPWRVRDVNSRAVVRSGSVGINNRMSGRVPGLYGYYQLELRGCTVTATGVLDND